MKKCKNMEVSKHQIVENKNINYEIDKYEYMRILYLTHQFLFHRTNSNPPSVGDLYIVPSMALSSLEISNY